MLLLSTLLKKFFLKILSILFTFKKLNFFKMHITALTDFSGSQESRDGI